MKNSINRLKSAKRSIDLVRIAIFKKTLMCDIFKNSTFSLQLLPKELIIIFLNLKNQMTCLLQGIHLLCFNLSK